MGPTKLTKVVGVEVAGEAVMRKALVLTLAVVLGCPAWVAGQDVSRVYPSEEAFTASIAPLRQAVERNPRDPEAHYRLGFAYFTVWRQFEMGLVGYGRDYHRLAETEFRAALAAAPDHVGSLLALYALLRLRGDWRDAEGLVPSITRLTLPVWEVPAVR